MIGAINDPPPTPVSPTRIPTPSPAVAFTQLMGMVTSVRDDGREASSAVYRSQPSVGNA